MRLLGIPLIPGGSTEAARQAAADALASAQAYSRQLIADAQSSLDAAIQHANQTATDAVMVASGASSRAAAADDKASAADQAAASRTTDSQVADMISAAVADLTSNNRVRAMISNSLVDRATTDAVAQMIAGAVANLVTATAMNAAIASAVAGKANASDLAAFAKLTDLAALARSADVTTQIASAVANRPTASAVTAQIAAAVAASQMRVEQVSGTTTSLGAGKLVFATPFTSPPVVDPSSTWVGDQLVMGQASNITVNGCDVTVKRSRGTLVLTTGPFEPALVGTTFRMLVIGR